MDVSRQFSILISTVIVMVACFYDSPKTCILLFLTRLQAWGCKTPQILTSLRRTGSMLNRNNDEDGEGYGN